MVALVVAARPSGRPWKLRLYLDAALQYVWPRSDSDCGWLTVELEVGADGFVDLRPWAKLAHVAARESFCRKVFNLVLRGIRHSCERIDLVTLMALLATAVGTPAEKALAQICLRLSIQVELALGEQPRAPTSATLG